MEQEKIVYIVGRTDVPRFWEQFEAAEDALTAEGFIPLSPSRLPWPLPEDKVMQLHTAGINVADAVLFLPGWNRSTTAQILMAYAKSLGKPVATSIEQLKEVCA